MKKCRSHYCEHVRIIETCGCEIRGTCGGKQDEAANTKEYETVSTKQLN